MASQLKITLVKSYIGTPEKHRKVLAGLGLTRRSKSVNLQDTPEVRGMINKVSHMLKVDE
jgi:large subunit ribosomal protein L30